MNVDIDFFPHNELENSLCKTFEIAKPKAIVYNLKRKIVVMDKQVCVFLKIDDIAYAEANGAYTIVYFLNGKKMIVCKNMKSFSERLPESEFIRVHKSYIININSIDKYVKSDGGYLILENGQNIPVSVRKKQYVVSLIDQWAV